MTDERVPDVVLGADGLVTALLNLVLFVALIGLEPFTMTGWHWAALVVFAFGVVSFSLISVRHFVRHMGGAGQIWFVLGWVVVAATAFLAVVGWMSGGEALDVPPTFVEHLADVLPIMCLGGAIALTLVSVAIFQDAAEVRRTEIPAG